MATLTEAPLEALDLNYARLPKSNRNQYDRSTIVSIFPIPIEETKPTIQPAIFKIPAGSIEDPAVVAVGSASWWKLFTDMQPPIEVICSSVEIAHSIIYDYCNGLPECNMEDKTPGLFFIPGKEVDAKEVKMKYLFKLKDVETKQRNWYSALINHADSLWSRSNGNPLVIWELMRIAAKELGQLDKPWLANVLSLAKVKCFACGSLRDPEFPICPTCKTIDMSHPKAKDIRTAG